VLGNHRPALGAIFMNQVNHLYTQEQRRQGLLTMQSSGLKKYAYCRGRQLSGCPKHNSNNLYTAN
jgi:ABC-type phosphate/phosphonate transport system ATPase subunit